MMWTCAICKEQVTTADLVPHFDEKHPEMSQTLGPLEMWPDGGPVIEDPDLSPSDFEENPGNLG